MRLALVPLVFVAFLGAEAGAEPGARGDGVAKTTAKPTKKKPQKAKPKSKPKAKTGSTKPATSPAASPGSTTARRDLAAECLAALAGQGVPFVPGPAKEGIAIPVEITGPIGGVSYRTWKKHTLVLDCSLVYSLARAGRFLTEAGVSEVLYSSSYQRRNVRGTTRASKHSYALAIDLHEFNRPDGSKWTIAEDFEQGLGDAVDCIGAPLTEGGRALRTIWCRMDRSGLFRFILSPDSDEDHYNHFHIEARSWGERPDVTAPASQPAASQPAASQPVAP